MFQGWRPPPTPVGVGSPPCGVEWGGFEEIGWPWEFFPPILLWVVGVTVRRAREKERKRGEEERGGACGMHAYIARGRNKETQK